jgi:hypothetical protein
LLFGFRNYGRESISADCYSIFSVFLMTELPPNITGPDLLDLLDLFDECECLDLLSSRDLSLEESRDGSLTRTYE